MILYPPELLPYPDEDDEAEVILAERWRQVQLSAEMLRKIIYEELGGTIH